MRRPWAFAQRRGGFRGIGGGKPVSILVAGDSIDLDLTHNGGWRGLAQTYLAAQGVRLNPVGPFGNDGLAYAGGPEANRAVNGEKANGVVATRNTAVTGWIAQIEAYTKVGDVVTLGWGTNDMSVGEFTAAQTLANMATLIDDVVSRGRIAVVRNVILRGATKSTFIREITKYNNGLPALCAAHGATCVYVPPVTLADDVHPTWSAGYQGMADALGPALVAVVRSALPAAPTLSTSALSSGTPITIAGTGFSSYRLYRDGADAGAIASPYTPVKADFASSHAEALGPALTIVGVTAAGAYVPAGGLQYNYGTVTALREAFEFYDLTPGSISTLTGKKAGISLTAGTAATASATGLNGKPSLASTGTSRLTGAAGTTFTGDSAVQAVFAATDAGVGVGQVILELTASVGSTNGAFLIATGQAADKVAGAAHGTGGGTGRSDCPASLASPTTLAICPDTSLVAGCAFIRVDGAAQSLTNQQTACASGNFANANLSLFSRESGAAPWALGVMGGALLILGGNAQNADLTDAEYYVMGRAGL